jgi:hypothetical protein
MPIGELLAQLGKVVAPKVAVEEVTLGGAVEPVASGVAHGVQESSDVANQGRAEDQFGSQGKGVKVVAYKPAGRESWYFHLHGKHVPTPSRQIRRGGFKTQAEAQREGRKIAKAIDDGTFVARNAETIAGFPTAWIEYKTPTLKPSAAQSYADSVRAHLMPHIGHCRVQDLRPEHIASMISAMLTTRSDRRGGLSPKSVRNHVGVLHAALDAAVRWGRVQRNVVDVVQLPRWERTEPRTWTSAQMRAFLTATAPSRDAAAWRWSCRRASDVANSPPSSGATSTLTAARCASRPPA